MPSGDIELKQKAIFLSGRIEFGANDDAKLNVVSREVRDTL
ncbi:hypothetical protein [Ciceribacter sp. RN22]|nr:hypothetical protein [Ciceribacter sp. RN22]